MPCRGLRMVVLVAFLSSPVAMARAEFCEDLERVLDSAADGFSEVRGDLVSEQVDPLSNTRVVWQCTLALTGAQTCEVEWHRQAYSYNTFWHKQDEGANTATFAALTELLTGCGLSQKSSTRSGRSLWFVRAGDSNLDLVLAHNGRRVRLSITTSGFANP